MSREKTTQLPEKFDLSFLDKVDGRSSLKSRLIVKLDKLKADGLIDSTPKELIAHRIIYLAEYLEAIEQKGASDEFQGFPATRYFQGINSLTGLLRSLGLEAKKDMATAKNVHEIIND